MAARRPERSTSGKQTTDYVRKGRLWVKIIRDAEKRTWFFGMGHTGVYTAHMTEKWTMEFIKTWDDALAHAEEWMKVWLYE